MGEINSLFTSVGAHSTQDLVGRCRSSRSDYFAAALMEKSRLLYVYGRTHMPNSGQMRRKASNWQNAKKLCAVLLLPQHRAHSRIFSKQSVKARREWRRLGFSQRPHHFLDYYSLSYCKISLVTIKNSVCATLCLVVLFIQFEFQGTECVCNTSHIVF